MSAKIAFIDRQLDYVYVCLFTYWYNLQETFILIFMAKISEELCSSQFQRALHP